MTVRGTLVRAREALGDGVALVLLSARRTFGRWTPVLPFVPLTWTAFQALRLLLGWRPGSFRPADVPVSLLGLPLSLLALALGVRVIAGEIEERTLEVAWTVPGGARKVWLGKLGAAVAILAAGEVLLAGATWLFLAPFPWSVTWTAFQAALFHLALGTWLAVLLRSEVGGVLLGLPAWVLALLSGSGDHPSRVSPFFDPLKYATRDASEVAAWTLQNRVGVLLVVLVLLLLAFERVEDRERMLG